MAYRGTYDDIDIDDDDVLRLEQMLKAKWNYFLIEMDKYNRARDSSLNTPTATKFDLVYAESFQFLAQLADGTPFGPANGTQSTHSWVKANDAGTLFGSLHADCALFVPSYDHVMTVRHPGRTVVLEGYHEHLFVGNQLRDMLGEARQLAFEEIVFSKTDRGWRVTDFVETIYPASEMTRGTVTTI